MGPWRTSYGGPRIRRSKEGGRCARFLSIPFVSSLFLSPLLDGWRPQPKGGRYDGNPSGRQVYGRIPKDPPRSHPSTEEIPGRNQLPRRWLRRLPHLLSPRALLVVLKVWCGFRTVQTPRNCQGTSRPRGARDVDRPDTRRGRTRTDRSVRTRIHALAGTTHHPSIPSHVQPMPRDRTILRKDGAGVVPSTSPWNERTFGFERRSIGLREGIGIVLGWIDRKCGFESMHTSRKIGSQRRRKRRSRDGSSHPGSARGRSLRRIPSVRSPYPTLLPIASENDDCILSGSRD